MQLVERTFCVPRELFPVRAKLLLRWRQGTDGVDGRLRGAC